MIFFLEIPNFEKVARLWLASVDDTVPRLWRSTISNEKWGNQMSKSGLKGESSGFRLMHNTASGTPLPGTPTQDPMLPPDAMLLFWLKKSDRKKRFCSTNFCLREKPNSRKSVELLFRNKPKFRRVSSRKHWQSPGMMDHTFTKSDNLKISKTILEWQSLCWRLKNIKT